MTKTDSENDQNSSSSSDLKNYSLDSLGFESHHNNSTSESIIRHLQDELTKTKEQLIDQQTNFLQLQAQHRQDVEEKTSSFNSSIVLVYKEFTGLLKQSLLQQREVCYKEFKLLLEKQTAEQERIFAKKIEEMQAKYETHFNDKFERRLVDFQENLIKINQSEYEGIELKIKKVVNSMFKDEQSSEKAALKQSLEQIKRDLQKDTEKSVNQFFISHNESFKVHYCAVSNLFLKSDY